MFELNQTYANRRGNYTVVAINPPKMRVRYEDGFEADLNMQIQGRIWENIQAEREAEEATRAARERRAGRQGQFYVKTVSLLVADDLSIPGLRQRLAAARTSAPVMNPDARFIYYAIEPQVFFAVATTTGPGKLSPAKGYISHPKDGEQIWLYPIDVDAHAPTLALAVPLDSIELESLPDFRVQLQQPDAYLPISEDDFELLAELLTEVTDVEDDELLEDEDEEEEVLD